ncbi:hypothetical protein Q31b_19340 [Novipirellula aureliae]|uniref:Putative zinc-ribbon domain-containing protein n=2 Tax=Novipirellula aureliae TaxID=2527966 RepID=A0A5C6E6D6_9BACT|nr:hypothetical protein Q31b_19340 [Novipirellula aureliae]
MDIRKDTAPLNQIPCPNCGKHVDDRAVACPHCGEKIYVNVPGDIASASNPPPNPPPSNGSDLSRGV